VVLDDDPDARRILQAVLEYGGAVVSATATARDALGLMERVRADVILAAVGLPGEDGYWLVQQVRNRPPDRGGPVPVVGMTRGDDARDKVLAAGFTEHVRQPIAIDVLYRTVASVSVRRPRR
jgi:CheY-like chemotaxis protein